MTDTARTPDVNVVVVGAGFAGLYLPTGCAGPGFSTRVFEAGDDVGGTWYWNRYPGARCDIQSIDYCTASIPSWQREWQWSEKYATQPEILRYLQPRRRQARPAPRHPLLDPRRRARAGTMTRALACRAPIAATTITCRFYVMATGCLSMPKPPDIAGSSGSRGEVVLHQPLAA